MNNSISTRRSRLLGVAALAAVSTCLLGCQTNSAGVDADNPDLAEFVRLMTPRKIEIQHYLTKPHDFAGTGDADGIEVILTAQDSFGDSIKCVGTFHFEINTRRLASGDKVGDRVAFWSVTIDSDRSLIQYWDRLTRSYRFPLKMTDGKLKPGRYVLTARLITPTDDKLSDQYEFTNDGG